MKRPQLIIAPGKEKALLRRHPWVFSGAVKRIVGEPQEGDLVDVVDARGQWMAMGHFQNESIICKVEKSQRANESTYLIFSVSMTTKSSFFINFAI